MFSIINPILPWLEIRARETDWVRYHICLWYGASVCWTHRPGLRLDQLQQIWKPLSYMAINRC